MSDRPLVAVPVFPGSNDDRDAVSALEQLGADARRVWHDEPALTVVMAAKGYPGHYEKGTRIAGLDRAETIPGVQIFHAGTVASGDWVLANGGRVLAVTASAKTVAEAQRRAYEAIGVINWPEGFCRRDIGWQAVARERREK